MEESFLQEILIEKIKTESFLESIGNIQSLEDALKIDHDPNTIPDFSIDHLLKRKYSKSAKSVLKTLTCYELISGDKIKNISLDKSERLFPDCLLFNYETNEIVVIENKISKQTEREAVTELLGYSQEIRNNLPFISDFDISYIIISTEFNTLLDHSISAQILSTESKILCLKATENKQQVDFDVHFPKSWTNIGQDVLPASSFMSYTLCLKKKNDVDISYANIVQLATDLISFDANQNKCSGFCIAWENGIADCFDFDFGISIYSINPFVFFESFGVIGDFLRYFYYHPAVGNHFFHEKELLNSSPNIPRIALQIINIITGNYLFKKGHFSAKDVFLFGRQLYLYSYACQTALETSEDNMISNEAFLFWSTLPLIKSIKEINLRVIDAVNIKTDNIPPIKIYYRKESVESEYRQRLDEFVEWFANSFLVKDSIHSNLFKIGLSYAPFFSDFFKDALSSDNIREVKEEINKYTTSVLSSIISSFKGEGLYLNDNDKSICYYLFDCDIEKNSLEHILEQIQKKNYEYSFSNEVLELVNSVYGEVYHELEDVFISESIDFNFLKQTADERFNAGHKYSAVIVFSNGEVGLGEINQEYRIIGELSDTDEIYLILNPASGMAFIKKKMWKDIFNGNLDE